MQSSARIPGKRLRAVGRAAGIAPDDLRDVARAVKSVGGFLIRDVVGERVGRPGGVEPAGMQRGHLQLMFARREFHLRAPPRGVGANVGHGNLVVVEKCAQRGLAVDMAIGRVGNGGIGFGINAREGVGDAIPQGRSRSRRRKDT